MEFTPFVALGTPQMILRFPCTELAEVLCCSGNYICKQLHLDSTKRFPYISQHLTRDGHVTRHENWLTSEGNVEKDPMKGVNYLPLSRIRDKDSQGIPRRWELCRRHGYLKRCQDVKAFTKCDMESSFDQQCSIRSNHTWGLLGLLVFW